VGDSPYRGAEQAIPLEIINGGQQTTDTIVPFRINQATSEDGRCQSRLDRPTEKDCCADPLTFRRTQLSVTQNNTPGGFLHTSSTGTVEKRRPLGGSISACVIYQPRIYWKSALRFPA
jgi:hypothetical protein